MKVDLTAPQTTIDSAPADPSNDPSPSFAFSSSEAGSTFECRLDGGAWSACTSPRELREPGRRQPHLPGARHRRGGPHGRDARPRTRGRSTPNAPNTTCDDVPPIPSNDDSPSFEFSANEPGSTFECRLDGGAWNACTSPETVGLLADGSHTFQVRATDAAGNVDATPASYTWTVDTVAPDSSFTVVPADPTNDATPDLRVHGERGRLHLPVPPRRRRLERLLQPGDDRPARRRQPHLRGARDRPGRQPGDDARGLHLDRRQRRALRLDRAAERLRERLRRRPVHGARDEPRRRRRRRRALQLLRRERRTAPAAPGSRSAPTRPRRTRPPGRVDADGNRALRAVATDTASNTGAAVVNVTIDRTVPATTIDSAPSDPSASTSASFAFSASEGGASFECRLDAGAWGACSSPQGYTGLGRGQPHLPRARDRRRRQRRPDARDLLLDGRHGRPADDDRRRARRPERQPRAELPVLLERGRLHVRVPPRRRRLERLLEPAGLRRPRRRQPHLPGARHRRRRQRRRHPRLATRGRSTRRPPAAASPTRASTCAARSP